MRAWTDISVFDRLDLTESFILSWTIEGGDVVFEADFLLIEGHPNYRRPSAGEWACFRRGTLKFPNVRSLKGLPSMADVHPAIDANGEIDYGHFDSLVEVVSGQFELSGDFGVVRLECDQPTVGIHTNL
jgi:hypothetical protein